MSMVESPRKKKAKPEAESPEPAEQTRIVLRVPVDNTAQGYIPEQVTLRMLSRTKQRQRANLFRLFHGLRKEGATLLNGHHIDEFTHAVEWLLENLGEWTVSTMGDRVKKDGESHGDIT